MAIGNRIKLYREHMHMTQAELAKRLNTTPQNIYKYEMGIITNIPLSKIEAMAEIFDIPPERLAGWKTPNCYEHSSGAVGLPIMKNADFFTVYKNRDTYKVDGEKYKVTIIVIR